MSLKEMSYEELLQALVVCHYACDHNAADIILDEIKQRPEYYEED